MTMVVRDAEPRDIASACALWLRAEAARTGTASSAAEVDELITAMTAALAKKGARLLVGLVDDQLVATAYGVPLKADPTRAQVAMLAVEPASWGNGHGTEMLGALTRALQDQGCTALRMNVDPANERARALYERQGWRHLGETEKVDHEAVPELIYRTDLS
jgi:ribosomal protein S18 acetylase RimI-like enzyme